jgi:D-alanyl-D-alanine-carboxypeptidase/D-alanyl-D-alanine-endopeptidase
MSVDVAGAGSWEETKGYVDDLHYGMPESICIAIAKIDPIEVKKYRVGDCSDDSLFQIGTITKTFTSLLLADAVLSGKVTLDTPIGEILGTLGVEPNNPSITLLDLATHTSGLPRRPDNLRASNKLDPYRYYDEARLHSFLQNHQPISTPGERFGYSSIGISLLGYLISVVQGESYANLIRTKITGPLGMRSTFVDLNKESQQRILPGHNNLYSQVPDWQLQTMAPALGIYSTLDDMVTFVQANLAAPEGNLGERLALAKKSHRNTNSTGSSVGFGWMIREYDDQRVYWHNGIVAGHRGFVGYMDGFETGAVVLSNAVFSEVDVLGAHLLSTDVTLPEIADDEGGDYHDYLGIYHVKTALSFKITADSHDLYWQATDQPRSKLESSSEDVFMVTDSDIRISFQRGKRGDVVAIELWENEAVLKGKKAGRELDRTVMRIARETLDTYVGLYRLTLEIFLKVTREGTALFLQITGQEIQQMFASTETRFFVEGSDAEIEFNGRQTRPASSLTLIKDGRQRAKRHRP